MTETFRAVEPLWEMEYGIRTDKEFCRLAVLDSEIALTVAEFRKLIEWGLRALPCEHKNRETVFNPDAQPVENRCIDCGETLP